ncbi:MAG: pimeloyl-ACP methyl ester carboxylesterase [Pseudohongiellaceae bacterium]|jgi:pimeloyl-ACP methyl ester carboxylesterase
MVFSRRRFLEHTATIGAASVLSGALSPVSLAQTSGVKPAPMMPAPTFVDTNGIAMAVYEKGQGPAVVFCHGWPELAFSWRSQIDAVAAAGFHAIAPDQRGFGLTGGPADPLQYDMQIFCDDLVGMLDAKGIEKATFVGHDWGGAVVWAMARLYPDRCSGIIGLNTGAGRPAGLPPLENSEPSLIVFGPNYYVGTFQEPGRAEAVLEADVRKTFDFILSRGGIWDQEAFAKLPETSAERQMDLLSMLQREDPPGEPFMSEEVMNYFTETYTATGFTGGLNWYRAVGRMGPIMAAAAPRIEVPCLYIGAENDVILPPSSADGMEDFITDLEKYTVADSGHWTQQEQPSEVNLVIVQWLKRKIA